MSRRKWPVGSFVPCSPRHLHCSPAHAEFVRNYRIERHRQEVMYETELTGRGENEHWRANGGCIVTFKSWLIAHKGTGQRWQQDAWERQQNHVRTEPKCVGIPSAIEQEQSAIYEAASSYA